MADPVPSKKREVERLQYSKLKGASNYVENNY
jgi:hypothetical protein